MDERYQDMLRAMQMARARAHEAGPSQAQLSGGVPPQAHERAAQQRVQHAPLKPQQQPQRQVQQTPLQQQDQTHQTSIPAQGQAATRESLATAPRAEPFELQVMQRVGIRAGPSEEVSHRAPAADLDLTSQLTGIRQEMGPELRLLQNSDGLSLERKQQPEELQPQYPHQQQHHLNHQQQALQLAPSPGVLPLRAMEVQGFRQPLVLDLSNGPSDRAVERLPLDNALILDSPGQAQQPASTDDLEAGRHGLSWQQQYQQQEQLLLLLHQQRLGKVTPAQLQLHGGSGAIGLSSAVADMLQSRRRPHEHDPAAQHEQQPAPPQQQEGLQLPGGQWEQGTRRESAQLGVVDLTNDDDPGTALAGVKRRLPASFLKGGGAASKRPAPGPVVELSLGGSGSGTMPDVELTAPQRRRMPASLLTAAADASSHAIHRLSQLHEHQQPQQQEQQGQVEDPRRPNAREQQFALHLEVVQARLREGTVPVGRGSKEMRPMTGGERQRFEEAAHKLQRQIEGLQQERRKLLLAMQQQHPHVSWVAAAAAAQQPQPQLPQRVVMGAPPITTGMPDRLRGAANGITLPKGSLPPLPLIAVGAGGSGGGGTASGSGSAALAPTTVTVARALPAPGSSPKEPPQSRVTEHQQALRAVIESLQVSGSEELEPPPRSLQVTVLRHQRMALAWMIRRETGSEPRGGILADDQGLGKTVTTISLIVTHTNPEEAGLPRGAAAAAAAPPQQQRRSPGEVVELEDDDDDDEDEEDMAEEEEGEEDVDACGVRLGALRAEREAAGAADAAEAEGAVAEMMLMRNGDGVAGAPGSQAQAEQAQTRPETTATDAERPDNGRQEMAVKAENGMTAAATAGPSVVSLLDDDDDNDSPVRPHKTCTSGATGVGVGGISADSDDPDILSITDGPGPSTVSGGSSFRSLPPTAAGSLSQLASSNLAASGSNSAAALLSSHRQLVSVQPGAAGGRQGHGHHSNKGPLYEPEPPNLLLGGTLVVCPTSVLHQWAREIRDKVSPAAGLVVHVYHGKDRASSARQLAAMGVVLTTYGTLAQEAPSRDKQAVRLGRQGTSNTPINLAADDSGGEDPAVQGLPTAKGKGSNRPRSKPPADPAGGALYQIKWKRVVLDEAQSIKNPRTLAAHAAWRLFAHCRWCLSGTPIQNTVDDLYSYFRFLRYAPYCESRKFKELIKTKIVERPEIGYKFLQAVLQAVLLRRTKQSTINGEPIIKLPAREQQLLRVKFSAQEAAFYSQVQADSLRAIKEARDGGVSGSRQYVNMLHSLLKLRQACNHPWLVRGARNTWHKTGPPSASEVEAARRLSPEVRSALVAALSRGGDAQCPCCGDIAEDPVASICGHVFCAQCLAAQKEGAGVEGELLCPACSRLLRGSDLHSAAALAAVDPTLKAGGGGGSDAGGGGGGPEWVSSAKVERLLSLLECIRAKSNEQAGARDVAGASAPLPVKSKSDKRMAGALRKLPPLQSGAVAGAGMSHGGGGRPEKVIVFSQWTSMLDLLEIPMRKAKIHFRRLDGTMSVANRERAIQDFEVKPDVMVLLVSLKAAALGVNLTVANHVVLMDLWWNPTTEEQAIDRAHRIGQTRTVHVTRITIAGSVEDRILELQQVKRELVAAALTEGRDGSAAAGRLTMDDLDFLFRGLSQ